MKKINKKKTARLVILTLIVNLVFSNIMPIKANAILGLIFF